MRFEPAGRNIAFAKGVAIVAIMASLAAPALARSPERQPQPFWSMFFNVPEAPAAQPQKRTATKAKRPTTRAKDYASFRADLRKVIASEPSLLRPVVSDLIRTDPEIRRLFSPAPAPSAVSTAEIPADQARVEKIIREYLLRHPEVLEEAMRELEKRQTAAEADKARKAIKDNAQALFNSPRQVTLGNPKGDVTMVEFFDYNCGYCKRALGDMLDMMKADPNLRVVLKEFPVLGQGSAEAAQVAVAVSLQDKSGRKYLDFHQKLLNGRGSVDKVRAMAAAKEAGFDMARLEKDLTNPEVKATIEENLKLAETLGVNGTPSYVVGNDLVIGAVGRETLTEKVNTARCGKASC